MGALQPACCSFCKGFKTGGLTEVQAYDWQVAGSLCDCMAVWDAPAGKPPSREELQERLHKKLEVRKRSRSRASCVYAAPVPSLGVAGVALQLCLPVTEDAANTQPLLGIACFQHCTVLLCIMIMRTIQHKRSIQPSAAMPVPGRGSGYGAELRAAPCSARRGCS